MSNNEPLRAAVDSHYWFHSIDFGDGVVSKGTKTPEILAAESEAIFRSLNLQGASVLDVGAWNGYYTLEAYRRGAGEVTAIDTFTWQHAGWRGRDSFDFVMQHFGYSPRTYISDVQTVSVDELGKFDVSLLLGVLYHCFDPIAALVNLAAMTTEAIVIETHIDASDYDRPAMVFYPGRELGERTNWWGPNRACIEAVVRRAGFPIVEMSSHPIPDHEPNRAIVHAYKSEPIRRKHNAAVA